MSGQPPSPIPTPSAPPGDAAATMLPPDVMRRAVPIALVAMGLTQLLIIGTLCFRLVFITVNLDGSSEGISATSPIVQSLTPVAVGILIIFAIIILGAPLVTRLLSIWGKL